MRIILFCGAFALAVILSALSSRSIALPKPQDSAEPARGRAFVPQDMPDKLDLRHVRVDTRKAYDNAVMRT